MGLGTSTPWPGAGKESDMETIGRRGTVEVAERFVLVYDDEHTIGIEMNFTTRGERDFVRKYLLDNELGYNVVCIDVDH